MRRKSLLITLISLLGSAVSFMTQMLIAHFFGVSASVDAYLLALSAPLFVTGLFASVFTYSLIPALIAYRGNVSRYVHFTRRLFFFTVVLTFAFACIGTSTADLYAKHFGKQIPLAYLYETRFMIEVAWIAAAMLIFSSMLTAIANSREKYLWPVAAAGLVPLFTAITCVVFAPFFGITVLPLGLAFGAGTSAAFLYWLVRRDFRHVSFNREQLRVANYDFVKNIPLVLAALACFSVPSVVDAVITSTLGVGDLSSLGYSQRLIIAIGNVVIIGPFTILGPTLAKAWKERRADEFQRALKNGMRVLFLIGAPTVLVLSLLAEPLVMALFQRGSFDAKATHAVAKLLPLMLLGMVPMLGVTLGFRAVFAKGDLRVAALAGVGWIVGYAVLGTILSRHLGVVGVALAYTTVWWVVFAFVMRSIFHGGRIRINQHIGRFAGTVLIALIVTGGVVHAVAGFILSLGVPGAPGVSKLVTLGMVIGISGLIYFLFTRRLFKSAVLSR